MSSPKRLFLAFLCLFFVINLLQSAFTGLLEDEAYYWVWSKNLAWGYFDHPPMVALFIWMGGLIFDSELGVRLLSAITFTLTLWIMWKTIDSEGKERDVRLFFLLVVSLAMIQVYGFISTPDTPLMLFTALFFYAYKRFLKDDRIQNSLILGFSMAALLYSKYHGILIIGFVTLSNLKLFLNIRFWIAGIFGFALFVPHLLWQYENDFPSFVYHLKDRAYKPYTIGFTLNHLLNILVVVGITFPIVYKAFWKKKASGTFEKSLKYTVFGFVLFFLLTSFKSQPQAQWLAAMLIPLGIFVYSYFDTNESARKWLYRLGLAQLGVVILPALYWLYRAFHPLCLSRIGRIPGFLKSEKKLMVRLCYSLIRTKMPPYTNFTQGSTHIPMVYLMGRKSQYSLLDTEKIYRVKPYLPWASN